MNIDSCDFCLITYGLHVHSNDRIINVCICGCPLTRYFDSWMEYMLGGINHKESGAMDDWCAVAFVLPPEDIS